LSLLSSSLCLFSKNNLWSARRESSHTDGVEGI
jgi:hypothetical protein